MLVPVNGHALPFLPALNRGYVTIEVSRDFLPGVKPLFGRALGWLCFKGQFAHRVLLIGEVIAGK
jgi:hypothetical protein